MGYGRVFCVCLCVREREEKAYLALSSAIRVGEMNTWLSRQHTHTQTDAHTLSPPPPSFISASLETTLVKAVVLEKQSCLSVLAEKALRVCAMQTTHYFLFFIFSLLFYRLIHLLIYVPCCLATLLLLRLNSQTERSFIDCESMNGWIHERSQIPLFER